MGLITLFSFHDLQRFFCTEQRLPSGGINIVSPPLHERSPLFQIVAAIVGRFDLVFFLVCQCRFQNFTGK